MHLWDLFYRLNMTLMALPPRALVSKASSTSCCEKPNLWVIKGLTSILPVFRNSMQSGHVFLYRNMPITSTSLTPRKNLNDQQYEIKVQRQKNKAKSRVSCTNSCISFAFKCTYLAAAGVRGAVISLRANPIRQTLPPERVAFNAVDMVLSKPTQSKLISMAEAMAFCIFTTSSLTS